MLWYWYLCKAYQSTYTFHTQKWKWKSHGLENYNLKLEEETLILQMWSFQTDTSSLWIPALCLWMTRYNSFVFIWIPYYFALPKWTDTEIGYWDNVICYFIGQKLCYLDGWQCCEIKNMDKVHVFYCVFTSWLGMPTFCASDLATAQCFRCIVILDKKKNAW